MIDDENKELEAEVKKDTELEECGYTVDNVYEKTELRVIGWIDYGDFDFPDAALTDEVYFVVAREVRDKGYLFGGDMHEEGDACCPVLSDGTAARFSWRGWGGVIAIAMDERTENGKYNYSLAYMNEFIKESYRKYPKRGVDFSLLDKSIKQSTRNVHVYCRDYDTLMGRFFICPMTEEMKAVERFDYVYFTGRDETEKYLNDHILNIYTADTFEELIKLLENESCHFDYDACGYDNVDTAEELLAALRKDYPEGPGECAVCFRFEDLWA